MDKLILIIGKAPTELTPTELRTKLLNERDRVRRGLDYFKNMPLRGKGKRKKATKATKLTALMKEAGLSPQQLLKGIELLKQQQAQAKPAPPEREGDK